MFQEIYMQKRTLYPALPLFALLALVCAACAPDPEPEVPPISQITITNIPAKFPLEGEDENKQETFTVYLNASNSTDHTKPPVAKGWMDISKATEQGTDMYTVTIQLQNPNPADDKDPTKDTGNWTGVASYFSIVLSPKSPEDHKGDDDLAVKAIWIKGGLDLNGNNSTVSWAKLLNAFREYIPIAGDTTDQGKALYKDIVKADTGRKDR